MEMTRVAVMLLALLCFLTAFGFGIVSVTTSEWYVDKSNTTAGAPYRRGLWIRCDFDGVCQDFSTDEVDDELRTTRAFTIMALIAACATLIACLLSLDEEGQKWKLVAFLAFMVTALLQLIGVGVYTDELRNNSSFNQGNWGYSFEMAWAAVFLYGIGGLLYLIVATVLQAQTRVRYSNVRA